MSAQHRRAARREAQAADLLGVQRIKRRRRYERQPDAMPVRLTDGAVLVPEVKTRAKLPRWLLAAVDQARSYVRGSIPLVVLSGLGGEPLAVLPLRDLVRVVGIREPKAGEQLILLGGPR